ncbi:MAG TPA: vitamin K epoxide reductase family protein [Gemmatimonadales bacterium]
MRRRQAITLLALVGCFVSLYLWLYKIGIIGSLQCGAGGCETVQTSRWAELLGLPVALYGVVGYAVLFALSLAALQPRLVTSRRLTWTVAALATVGFLFTVYLTYLELFVINALCRWCVVSAVIMTAIWVVAVLDLRAGGNPGALPRGQPTQAGI